MAQTAKAASAKRPRRWINGSPASAKDDLAVAVIDLNDFPAAVLTTRRGRRRAYGPVNTEADRTTSAGNEARDTRRV